MTASVTHISVLGREAVEFLAPRSGGIYVDATFGAGGYSRAILAVPGTRVIGIDRDRTAIAAGYDLGDGADGRLTLVEDRFSNLAAICAAVAVTKLKQPSPHFPSLTSRLRVAIKANPLQPDQLEAARDAAASVLLAPSAPPTGARGRRRRTRRDNRSMHTGLIVAAALLGWAAARRRSHARQPDV